MKLLLVDGSNVVMRAAFGGEVAPEQAVPIASGLIRRAARQVAATHLVVALDSPEPSWRKAEYPDYKAHRTGDTSPWLRAAFERWTRDGWWVEALAGFEADDILATVASRARQHQIVVLSGDSDVFPLLDWDAEILKPLNGGQFQIFTRADVCQKYNIAAPSLLTDLKAMVGESGDNVPGVPGIGPVKAAKLLERYASLEGTIAAGLLAACKESQVVAAHAPMARMAFRLLTLRQDAPVVPIQPSGCALKLAAVADRPLQR